MRKKIVLTDKQIAEIETLAGLGLTQTEIATVLGIGEKTLRRRKREKQEVLTAIERGKCKAKVISGRSLLNKVKQGDVPAIRWFETTRFGMSEKRSIEHDLNDKQLKKMAEEFLR